jgi:hypothetical protein
MLTAVRYREILTKPVGEVREVEEVLGGFRRFEEVLEVL